MGKGFAGRPAAEIPVALKQGPKMQRVSFVARVRTHHAFISRMTIVEPFPLLHVHGWDFGLVVVSEHDTAIVTNRWEKQGNVDVIRSQQFLDVVLLPGRFLFILMLSLFRLVVIVWYIGR